MFLVQNKNALHIYDVTVFAKGYRDFSKFISGFYCFKGSGGEE